MKKGKRERLQDSFLGENTAIDVTGLIESIRVSATQILDQASTQTITRILVGGEDCDPRNDTDGEV